MVSQEKKLLEGLKKILPDLIGWASYVDNVLAKDILSRFEDKNAVQMQPAYRVKNEKSFLCKALYRNKDYVDPLVDIDDKVATRVVLLKSSDIGIIKKLICGNGGWDAKVTKDTEQEIEDQPKYFDYQSLHVVVSPKKENDDYDADLKPMLTCEIQIRTLLQHAFAEISHDSSYKGPYKNDREIIRHLSKSMALMEATDDYFCKIFKLMLDDERFYRNYMRDLTSMYMSLVNDKESVNVDYFITETIIGLLEQKKVNIDDLKAFVDKEKSHLSKIISESEEVLYEQPAILLIEYYFKNNREFLKDEWPLSLDSLKLVYQKNNTSFELY